VKLKHFQKFENTTDALAAASALVDSKISKGKALIALRGRTMLAYSIQAYCDCTGRPQKNYIASFN